MKIYTRTGDQGQTGLIGGRADKDDIRIEAYGAVDELNSFVGQCVSFMADPKWADIKDMLLQIQHELFDCGTDLARAKAKTEQFIVDGGQVSQLESWIDLLEAQTSEITRFILPGGSLISSALHVCRTVCRRAERRIVSLAKVHEVNGAVLQYINRLSDLLFTAARAANAREGVDDVAYMRSAEVFSPRK